MSDYAERDDDALAAAALAENDNKTPVHAVSKCVPRPGTTFGGSRIYELAKQFTAANGLAGLLKRIDLSASQANLSLSASTLSTILQVISQLSPLLVLSFAKEYGSAVLQATIAALVRLSDADLRSLQLDNVRKMGCYLTRMSVRFLRGSEIVQVLDQVTLMLALRMIGCSLLPQQVDGMKMIGNAAQSVRIGRNPYLSGPLLASWILQARIFEQLMLGERGFQAGGQYPAVIPPAMRKFFPDGSLADIAPKPPSPSSDQGKHAHGELVRRLADITKFLFREKALPAPTLDLLWNGIADDDDEIVEAVIKILDDCTWEIPGSDMKLLVARMTTLPASKLARTDLLDVLKKFGTCGTLSAEVVPLVVDALWKAVFSPSGDVSTVASRDDAETRLLDIFTGYYNKQHRMEYLLRLCTVMQQPQFTVRAIRMISKILESYGATTTSTEISRSLAIISLNDSCSLLNQTVKSVVDYKVAVSPLVSAVDAERFSPFPAVDKLTHVEYVTSLVGFLKTLLQSSTLLLSTEQVVTLFRSLYTDGLCFGERKVILGFLADACSVNLFGAYFSAETSLDVFRRIILPYSRHDVVGDSSNTKLAFAADAQSDARGMTRAGFDAFRSFFFAVHSDAGKIERYGDYDGQVLCMPEKLDGIEHIWRVALEAVEQSVADVAATTLTSLHCQVTAGIREDHDHAHFSKRIIMQKFIDELSDVIKPNKADDSDAIGAHRCRRAIVLLQKLLDESDANGYGLLLRPHAARLRGCPVVVKFTCYVLPKYDGVPADCLPAAFELRLYKNSLIWDVKCALASRSGVLPSRFKLSRNRVEIPESQNSHTLGSFHLKDGDVMHVTIKSPGSARVLPLIFGASVGGWQSARWSPGAKHVLEIVWQRYSANGYMDKTQFAQYFAVCGVARVEPSRVESIFREFDRTPEGHMSKQGFFDFYREAAVSRETAVRADFLTHGFDGMFRPVLPAADASIAGDPTAIDVLQSDPRVIAMESSTIYATLHALIRSTSQGSLSAAAWSCLARLPSDPAYVAGLSHGVNVYDREINYLSSLVPANAHIAVPKVPLEEALKHRSNHASLYVLQILESFADPQGEQLPPATKEPVSSTVWKKFTSQEECDSAMYLTPMLRPIQFRAATVQPSAILQSAAAPVGEHAAPVGEHKMQEFTSNHSRSDQAEFDPSRLTGNAGEDSSDALDAMGLTSSVIIAADVQSPEDSKADAPPPTAVVSTPDADAFSPIKSSYLNISLLSSLPAAAQLESEICLQDAALEWRAKFLGSAGLTQVFQLLRASNASASSQSRFWCLAAVLKVMNSFLAPAFASSNVHADRSAPDARFIAQMQGELGAVVLAAVDFSVLQEVLLAVLLDAAQVQPDSADGSSNDDTAPNVVELCLQLWIDCVCHVPTGMASMLADMDQVACRQLPLRLAGHEPNGEVWCTAEQSRLNEIFGALLLCKNSTTIRKLASQLLFSFASTLASKVPKAQTPSPHLALLHVLLLRVTDLTNATTGREPCKQFFSITDRLLRMVSGITAAKVAAKDRKLAEARAKITGEAPAEPLTEAIASPASASASDFTEITLYLAQQIVGHHPTEAFAVAKHVLFAPSAVLITLPAPEKDKEKDADSPDEDELLVGMMQLLSTLLEAYPQLQSALYLDHADAKVQPEPSGAGTAPEHPIALVRSRSSMSASDLTTALFQECLFRIPTADAVVRAEYDPRVASPKCLGATSRAGAFKLLARVCDSHPGALRNLGSALAGLLRDSSKLDGFRNSVAKLARSEAGYVGLKNLGCICYMNATLQQLFMIPRFRFGVLSLFDKTSLFDSAGKSIDAEWAPSAANEREKDDMFYQLQRMFSFLSFSDRQDYIPRAWCNAFKDFSGSPTPTNVQQDATEFFTSFLDQVESRLKDTAQSDLIGSTCGGTVIYRKRCTKCNTCSDREESFFMLKLEIKSASDVHEALQDFCKDERIDDVMCDECKEKTTAVRRPYLQKLPNTLILNLNRLVFNYETFLREKINSRVAFPLDLLIDKYSMSGQVLAPPVEGQPTTSESVSVEQLHAAKLDNSYQLAGVVCHSGTAESGHYYSFIRDRATGKWNEFNDSHVLPFELARLEHECFGGMQEFTEFTTWGSEYTSKRETARNAYMLVYEKQESPELQPAVNLLRRSYGLAELSSGSNDSPFSQWIGSMVNNSASALSTNVLRGVIPPPLYRLTAQDNIQFAVDKGVYSPEFAQFIVSLSASVWGDRFTPSTESTDLLNVLFDYVVTMLVHTDKCTGYVESIVNTWLQALKWDTVTSQVTSSTTSTQELSTQLLNRVCSSQTAFAEVLLTSPEEKCRSMFAQLLSAALMQQFHIKSEQIAMKSALVAANLAVADGVDVTPVPCLIFQSLDRLIAMFPDAFKNWTRFAEFFGVFDCLSTYIPISSTGVALVYPLALFALEQYNITTRCMDGMLGSESPLHKPGTSPPVPSLAASGVQPNWAPAARLISRVARSRVRSAFPQCSSSEVIATAPMATIAPACSPSMNFSASLTPDEVRLLSVPTFWNKLLNSTTAITELCHLAEHLCWENPRATPFFTHIIALGLSASVIDDLTAYVSLLTRIVSLKDYNNLSEEQRRDCYAERIACLLGDPHFGTENAGAGLGLPPTPLSTDTSGEDSPFDAKMKYLSAIGVRAGSGILSALYRRRVASERPVCLAISHLLKLASENSALWKYLSAIPPFDPAVDTKYTDWFKRLLLRQWDTLQPAGKVPYTNVPEAAAKPDPSKKTPFDCVIDDVALLLKLERGTDGGEQGSRRANSDPYLPVGFIATNATLDHRWIGFDPVMLTAYKAGNYVVTTNDQQISVTMYDYPHPYAYHSDVEQACPDLPPTNRNIGYKCCYLKAINNQSVDINLTLNVLGPGDVARRGEPGESKRANHPLPSYALTRRLRSKE
jgi:ubiquitin C-terminal hydrolase